MSQESKEDKGNSGREIKLNQKLTEFETPITESISLLNNPSHESYYEKIFLNTALGVHKVLDGFLSYFSVLDLIQTSKKYRKIYTPNSIAIKALTEVIGPNHKLLIESNESAPDAFKRHRAESKHLKSTMPNLPYLSANLANNPNYYFSVIAHHNTFLYFDGLTGYHRFLDFIARNPASKNQLFQHIFSNFNNDLIAPIFSNKERFFETIKRNPELKESFIKHAVTSKKTIFLSHSFTFLELMLTHSKVKEEYPDAHLILIDLLREFPESGGLFISAVVSDDNLFRVIFPKRKIVDSFNNVLPQYKEPILTVFKKLPFAKIKFESEKNSSSIRSFPESKIILKQARMPLMARPAYFPQVFQKQHPKLIQTLSEYLDADSTLALSRTCKTLNGVYSDFYAKKLLLEKIGPDLNVLTKEIKSHTQAYRQHHIIQQHWKRFTKISNFEELSNLLKKIASPHYYIEPFIKPHQFRDFFYSPLNGNLSLLDFLKANPEHVTRIFEYLSKEMPLEDFNRMFSDGKNLFKLCMEFPIFVPCLFKHSPYGRAHLNFIEYYFSTLQMNEDGSYQPTIDRFLTILKFLPEHSKFICESVIANERLFNLVFYTITNIRTFSEIYPQYQETIHALFQLYSYDKSTKIKRTSHYYIAQLLFSQQINTDNLDLVPTSLISKSEPITNSQNLMLFLEPNDFLRVSLTNSNNRKLFYDLRYVRLIQDQIGPNPQIFIEGNKTPFIAYHRHRRFLTGIRLVKIKTTDELAERITKYPNYHVNQLVYFSDIRKILLPDSTEEIPYRKFLEFVKKHKQQQSRMIDFLCTDSYFFTQIILNHSHLISLANALPGFKEKILKAFLFNSNIFFREGESNKYFRDIIPDIDAIITLVNTFSKQADFFIPILVNKVISRYFLRDCTDLIKLIKCMDPVTTKKVVNILFRKNHMISYINIGHDEEDLLIELLKALYQLYDTPEEFVQKILKHEQFNNFINVMYRHFKGTVKSQPDGSLLIDSILAKPSDFLKPSDSILKESKPELTPNSSLTTSVYSSFATSSPLFFGNPQSLNNPNLATNERVEDLNIEISDADLNSTAETLLFEMD